MIKITMKKNILLLLIATIFSAFIGTSQETIYMGDSLKRVVSGHGTYIYYEDSVCFQKNLPPFSSLSFTKPEIIECDFFSFEVIKNGYARDKNYIFYNGIKLIDASHESFSVLEANEPQNHSQTEIEYFPYDYYARDHKKIFYGLEVLEQANPETFKMLSLVYAKDNYNVFFNGKVIEGTIAETFELVDFRVARDNKHVYYFGRRISDDPVHFEIVSNDYRYAKDKKYVFYWWGFSNPWSIDSIVDVNTDNFRTISYFYATDGEKVYRAGILIPDADISSFKILNNKYSKDKNYAFYRNSVISKANPKTFELLNEYFARDENAVYYMDSIVADADPESFMQLVYHWGKDKDYIYYENKRRTDIDYNTFVIEPQPHDKNYTYGLDGKIIKKMK